MSDLCSLVCGPLPRIPRIPRFLRSGSVPPVAVSRGVLNSRARQSLALPAAKKPGLGHQISQISFPRSHPCHPRNPWFLRSGSVPPVAVPRGVLNSRARQSLATDDSFGCGFAALWSLCSLWPPVIRVIRVIRGYCFCPIPGLDRVSPYQLWTAAPPRHSSLLTSDL